jgi:glycosyltransferase involved in cell wall biosynthesis
LQESPDGRDILILLLGDGAERQALKDRAQTEGISNVLFLDSVSKDEVTRYWSLLDVAIIHLKRNDLFKTVIPSKLFECMGMGIPVLHGVEGESAQIVEKSRVGITVEPENPVKMQDALLCLKRDRNVLERLSLNGPIAAKKYNRGKLAEDMLRILESVQRQPNSSKALIKK